MKNIFKTLLICFVAMTLTNCEDNSKSPLINDATNGGFVIIDLETLVIDVTNLDTSTYGGVISRTNDKVTSHEFSVRRISDGIASEFAPVYSTDTFPAEFRISADDIANAIGVTRGDLLPGDKFEFIGKTTNNDGTETTLSSLSSDILGESGQRQAYQLITYISCPFSADEAAGTYKITNDPFDASILASDDFEVVAGPGANQVTLIDVFGHARFGGLPTPGNFDIVVNVDPDTGIATVDDFEDTKQNAWDSANYSLSFGLIYLEEGNGFLFSCSGGFTISWRHTLPDGRSYGQQLFAAQKQ